MKYALAGTKCESEIFSDTDTAHIDFTDNQVRESKEIPENIYVNVDETGNIVSITVGHAKANAGPSAPGFFIARDVRTNCMNIPRPAEIKGRWLRALSP